MQNHEGEENNATATGGPAEPQKTATLPENNTPNALQREGNSTNSGNIPMNKANIDAAMARWTMLVGIFTALLVVTSLLQAWVVHGQLQEAREEQRPYVALKENIAVENAPRDQFGQFVFNATWVNNGNTPTTVNFVTGGGDDLIYKVPYVKATWLLGPKSELRLKDFFQRPDQIRNAFINGKRQFHILGWASYYDPVFSRTRQTRFCVAIEDLALSNNDTVLHGNAVPCAEPGTNCIDDECPKVGQ